MSDVSNKSLSSTRSALLMFVFALFALLLITGVNQITAKPIEHNERSKLISTLNELAGPEQNIDWQKIDLNQFPMTLCNAQAYPVARVVHLTALGYAGDIQLLLGLNTQQHITGVKVLQHHETPGIGDVIEANKSDWLKVFVNHAYNKLEPEAWQLKQYGGQFDGITGATITTKAVVKALTNKLIQQSQAGDKPADEQCKA